MKTSRIVLLFALAMFGCSDPMKQTLPTGDVAKWAEDPGMKRALEKLPDEQKKLLVMYMARKGLGSLPSGQSPASGG